MAGLAALLALSPSELLGQSQKAKASATAKADVWQVDAAKLPKRAPAAASCAQYGAGFVRLAGSETCVRVGGSMEAGVGINSGAGR